MIGNFVKLQSLENEDYQLFSKWLRPSNVSALARGAQDFVTVEELEKDIKNGNTRYATVLTHEDEKIGFVSWQPQKYEGSYMIGGVIGDEKLWDKGYGAEAALLLLDYLFHYKNAHKVQFINGLYNLRSVRFLIKSNVKIEGILRDYFFLDGKYYDAVISSILRDEYYAYDTDGFNRDMIPKTEKDQIRKEFYDFFKNQWEEEFLKFKKENV